jgi:hypothetical protein
MVREMMDTTSLSASAKTETGALGSFPSKNDAPPTRSSAAAPQAIPAEIAEVAAKGISLSLGTSRPGADPSVARERWTESSMKKL